MVLGQDWCLQCGVGAPGSIGTSSWRSTATILGITAVLALGAAAAGYAALEKSSPKPKTVIVARSTTPGVVTPGVTTPGVVDRATITVFGFGELFSSAA